MITLSLTPQQFAYLRAAVARDLQFLEEYISPWDIAGDDEQAEYEADVRLCKEMIQYLEVCDGR